jgi:GntR family transcriptional repressor for pyruvate dehydrogenase complex
MTSAASTPSAAARAQLHAPIEDRPAVHHAHELITEAIERHDGPGADQLMREHMRYYQLYCEARYPARMDDVIDWS